MNRKLPGEPGTQQSARMIFEGDGPSNTRMQYFQLQFEDPGFLSRQKEGCFTISRRHRARCSSFDNNASSHCRLPTMLLTAQAQLSRSKYNSGRGRKLEIVQNTREILQPPLRISQRSLCRKTRAIRGTHNRRWPPNNDGLLPSLDHQTALCCPHGGALYPPPYKSVFGPSHVLNISSPRPRPPPDGHAL